MKNPRMSRNRFLRSVGAATAGTIVLALAGCSAGAAPVGGTSTSSQSAPTAASPKSAVRATAAPQATGNYTLTIMWHWGKPELDALQPYFNDFTKANPSAKIQIETVAFSELLTKILVSRISGVRPDIYHIYDLWLPTLYSNGVVEEVPEEIRGDVTQNITKVAVEGATVQGKLVAFPSDLYPYTLVRNKKLFADAGLDPEKPPTTWAELKADADKLTKRGGNGAVTQAGYATYIGDTSSIVHPWMIFLWSDGGQLFSTDFKKSLFNSAEGLETTQFYKSIIPTPGLSYLTDIPDGKVAMSVIASWLLGTFQPEMKDKFENLVSSPPPFGKTGKPVTLTYNWSWIVDSKSQQKSGAWSFLNWLNAPEGKGKPSRFGTFLATVHGAIPVRTSDFQYFNAQLATPFMKGFVDSLSYSRPEPNLIPGDEVKKDLQNELEAVITGKEDAKAALANAQKKVDALLEEYYASS